MRATAQRIATAASGVVAGAVASRWLDATRLHAQSATLPICGAYELTSVWRRDSESDATHRGARRQPTPTHQKGISETIPQELERFNADDNTSLSWPQIASPNATTYLLLHMSKHMPQYLLSALSAFMCIQACSSRTIVAFPAAAATRSVRHLRHLVDAAPVGSSHCRNMLLFQLLRPFHRSDVVVDKVAVFMIGLPGAGKSRVIDYRYSQDPYTSATLNSTLVLDLDKEIVQHPEYDPLDPDRLYTLRGEAYRWADKRVEDKFLAGLSEPGVKRLVVDGTGTDEARQIRRMQQAREAGFFVKAMYVRVPVRTAIARAAMRKTGVTPERIQMYHSKMAAAMEVASAHADEVEVVDGDRIHLAPRPGTMAGTCNAPITVLG